MKISRENAEALAYYLDGVDGEVVEVTLSTNGASGNVDAAITVAVEDTFGIHLVFDHRYVDLGSAR